MSQQQRSVLDREWGSSLCGVLAGQRYGVDFSVWCPCTSILHFHILINVLLPKFPCLPRIISLSWVLEGPRGFIQTTIMMILRYIFCFNLNMELKLVYVKNAGQIELCVSFRREAFQHGLTQLEAWVCIAYL